MVEDCDISIACNASDNETRTPCAAEVQSAADYLHSATSTTLALLVVAAISTAATSSLFVYSTRVVLTHAKKWGKRGDAVILISIYPVYSVVSLLAMLLPRAAFICEAIASTYLSVVLWKMASSMVAMCGGKELMKSAMVDSEVSLKSPPCCCCCFCLPKVKISRRFINLCRGLIVQFLVLRPTLMGLAAILWADGSYDNSTPDPLGAFIYITVFSTASMMVAMYGLSLLFRASQMHRAGVVIKGRQAALIFVVLTTAVDGLIFMILAATGTIKCTPNAPAKQIATELYNFVVILEMFAICVMATVVYRRALTSERLVNDTQTTLVDHAAAPAMDEAATIFSVQTRAEQ